MWVICKYSIIVQKRTNPLWIPRRTDHIKGSFGSSGEGGDYVVNNRRIIGQLFGRNVRSSPCSSH